VWLDQVREEYGERLEVTWRSFSLDQVNSGYGTDRKVWEQPDVEERGSLLALWAGEAARRQGGEAFDRFHLALLTARHGGRRVPLNDLGVLLDFAGNVGLDEAQFRRDMDDRSLLLSVARDHTEAVERYGVFGTPTFVFENGNAVYLKTFIPPSGDSVTFFQHFMALMADRAYVGELKRPQPPWPRGALR